VIAETPRLIGRTATPCCNISVGRRLTALRDVGDTIELQCRECKRWWVAEAAQPESKIAEALGVDLAVRWGR
jgi:hypothetical protein